MLDVKLWLTAAGEPVADTAFVPGNAVPAPYITFLDTVKRGGGDMRNVIKTHSLTVERYSDIGDDNAQLESLFDAQAIKYTKEKQWLDSIMLFMTTYDFDLIEKN